MVALNLFSPFAQTTMGSDLLHEFQRLGETIVYENQELNHRWLCPPIGPIYVGDLNCFNTELNQRVNRVVYICDCHSDSGKDSYVNPLACNAWTIVLSTPNKRHYAGWLKPQGDRAILRMFMPVWSWEEVQAVVPAIYPPRQAAQRDDNGETVVDESGRPMMVDRYTQRFTIHGGSARVIFSREEDNVVMETLKLRIDHCHLKNVLTTASTDLRSVLPHEDVTWRLLRIIVEETDEAGKPSYQRVTLDFASEHILGRLVSRKAKAHQAELVSLLSDSVAFSSSSASSLRVPLFERYAVNVLSSGGTFRARWLNQHNGNDCHRRTRTDMWIHFPTTQQQGSIDNLQDIQVGVRHAEFTHHRTSRGRIRIRMNSIVHAAVHRRHSHGGALFVFVCVCVLSVVSALCSS